MKHSKIVLHKLTDADIQRLCCQHNFVKQEDAAENSVQERAPEASQSENEVPDSVLENITTKEEPMDYHEDVQQLEDDPASVASGGAVVAELTGSEVQRLRCKDDLMKQEAPTLDDGPHPTEGTCSILVKSEELDSEMGQITIKEEPIDWSQQTRVVDSFMPKRSSEDAMTVEKPREAELLDEPNREIQKSNSSSQELGLQDVARDAFLPGNCDKNRPCKRGKKSKREAYPNDALKAKKYKYPDRTKQSIREPFKCGLCDHSWVQKKNLISHQLVKHGIGEPLKCELCEYSCAWKTMLTQHQRAKHAIGEPFKCDECEYSCTYRGNLTQHQRAKHGTGELFKCDVCEYSCNWKTNLTRHQRAKHRTGEPFKCDVCEYSSAWKGNLKTHKRAKHRTGEPENK